MHLAEQQTAGRGRNKRKWVSPHGKNIYLSFGWKSSINHSQLEGLSLAVATCLIASLQEFTSEQIKIKWPNDLLVDGQKLAGILPRLFFRGGKLRLLRVGVGLNVFNNVPKEGISLKQIIGDKRMNINFWSSEVLLAIERSLDLLDNKNFLCSQVERRLWSRKYIDKETGLKWDIKGIDSSGGLNLSKEDKVKVLSDYA